MEQTALSLVPPLIVLALGYLTRRVFFSLFCGIIAAALIATNFSPIEAITLIGKYAWSNTEIANYASRDTFWKSEKSFTAIFLFILGILTTLIGYCGGTRAYGNFVKTRLKTKRSAESASLTLSFFLLVDDYFSSLTVGSVMAPITDSYKIPRAKLAFLVDSMAAPLAVLAPISAWPATFMAVLGDNGVGKTITKDSLILNDPLTIYFGALPCILYSFIIIASAWFIVRRGISFGLMGTFEKIAQNTSNLHGGKQGIKARIREVGSKNIESVSMIDFIVPIITLFITVLGGILYSGGFHLFGESRSLLGAFQNANPFIALFIAGIVSLCISVPYFLLRGKVEIAELPSLFYDGTTLMFPAVITLFLAWTFGDILRNNLHTGPYLATLLLGKVSVVFLPLFSFLVSLLISFSMGSSWGTVAIMFPIAIPMVISFLSVVTPTTIEHIPLLLPVLGAVLSGAIAGDHISPISDTTIMSSTSTGSHHIDHVRTQFTYAAPVIFSTSLAYLIAGLLQDAGYWIMFSASISVGIGSSLLILTCRNAIAKKR